MNEQEVEIAQARINADIRIAKIKALAKVTVAKINADDTAAWRDANKLADFENQLKDL